MRRIRCFGSQSPLPTMPLNRFGLFVVALLITACCAQEPPPIIPRLPDSFAPLSYVLRVEPNMTTKSVSGAVIITFNATFPQNETVTALKLHLGPDSRVNESAIVVLDLTSGLKKNTSGVEYDDDNTLFTVLLAEGSGLIGTHIYLISLQFESLLYSEPQGLFHGSFNETSWYVAAALRPTFARLLFPCFDEPRFRATVTLQVLRPADYAAHSTAALATSDKASDGQVLDTFLATEPIPIHGLGLLLTQLTPVVDSNLRLFAPPGTPPPSTIPFLSGFLGNISETLGPAPVGPVNLVVLPDRVRNTFSSIRFVYTTSQEYERLGWPLGPGARLAVPEELIRQHVEFPHSPAWWSHLWLSESVASFLALSFHPDQDVKDAQKIVARSVGADFSSGAVVNPNVESRWDIQRALSSQVIKLKGLSILLMWNDTLPEGVVSKTIVSFIKNSGSLVTTDEFLALLSQNIEAESTSYDATSLIPLLPAWLYSSSVPIVSYWPQPTNDSLVISQAAYPLSNDTSLFGLSVSYTQNDSRKWDNFRQDLWLVDNVTNLTTPLTTGQWTLLNLEAAPYRVVYRDASWSLLASGLSSDLASDVPESVLAAIQDDVVSFALEDRGYFSELFLTLNSTKRTTFDWIPVVKAFKVITYLIGPDTYIQSIFRPFAATLFPPQLLASLDLRNPSLRPDQLFVRTITSPWLCALDIGTCREAADELNQELLQGNWSRVDWSVAEVVVCSGVRYNASSFGPLMAAYGNTTDPGLRTLYASGLGCATDPAIVTQTLNALGNSSSPEQNQVGRRGRRVQSVSDSGLPMSPGDLQTFLTSLAGQQDNVPAIVEFLLNNTISLQSLIGPQTLADVIDVLGQFRIADVTKLSALQDQIGLDVQVAQSISQSIRRAHANIEWWKNNGASFETELAANQNLTVTTAAPSTEGSTTAVPTTGSSAPTTGGSTVPASTPTPSSAHHLSTGMLQTLAILTVALVTRTVL